MQRPARKQLPCCLGVFIIPLGADIADKHNLANLFAITRHIHQRRLLVVVVFVILAMLDDPHRQARHKPMPLPRH